MYVSGPARIVREDIDTFSGGPEKTVTLPCRTLGYPKPLISWYKNGVLLSFGDGKYSQDPSGNLRIKGLEPQDMGTYTCQATNQEGFDTVNVTLLVRGMKVSSFLSPFMVIMIDGDGGGDDND